MPTNRTPRARRSRHPRLPPEAVELYAHGLELIEAGADRDEGDSWTPEFRQVNERLYWLLGWKLWWPSSIYDVEVGEVSVYPAGTAGADGDRAAQELRRELDEALAVRRQ